MSAEEFLNEFAEVVAADRGTLSLETPLSSLDGWDSVAYLGLMVMLEEKMGATIPPDKLVEAGTPGEIYESAKALQ